MRFVALITKELRESLPLVVLLAGIFGLVGILIFWICAQHPDHYYYWNKEPGEFIGFYEFIRAPEPLTGIGPLLLGISAVLGLGLAAQHFGEQDKLKTWAFTIHRSVTRSTILWAKFCTAVIAFVVSLGSIWSLFFFAASKQSVFFCSLKPRIFLEGWIFIILGLIMYFSTTLAVLSKKRQRARGCGIGFALGLGALTLIQFSLFYSFVILVIGIVILLSQNISAFASREF